MGATVELEGDVHVLRITGLLRKAELNGVQARAVADWGPETRGKVLVIATGFDGWDRSDNWDDVTFYANYNRRFDKIAIVADPQWEAQLLMFTGAGIRRTPVRFFPSGQDSQARSWLSEAASGGGGGND
jgi:hypothetical protein